MTLGPGSENAARARKERHEEEQSRKRRWESSDDSAATSSASSAQQLSLLLLLVPPLVSEPAVPLRQQPRACWRTGTYSIASGLSRSQVLFFVVLVVAMFFEKKTKALSSLSLSLPPHNFSLLTLVLGQEHVRDALLDGELPPRLGTHQRPLDQAHLEQRVVERL